MDKRQHPRTASRASRTKEKVVLPSEVESEEDEEQEEEDLASVGTL